MPDTGEGETDFAANAVGATTAAWLLVSGGFAAITDFPLSGFRAATGTGGATGASTFSPFSPTAQSGAPMGTCEPTLTNCLSRMPSKNDSSSMVALSVSISASMSPDFTASPSCLSHLASVPTVMVSLSFGMSMIWAMGVRGQMSEVREVSQSRITAYPARPS